MYGAKNLLCLPVPARGQGRLPGSCAALILELCSNPCLPPCTRPGAGRTSRQLAALIRKLRSDSCLPHRPGLRAGQASGEFRGLNPGAVLKPLPAFQSPPGGQGRFPDSCAGLNPHVACQGCLSPAGQGLTLLAGRVPAPACSRFFPPSLHSFLTFFLPYLHGGRPVAAPSSACGYFCFIFSSGGALLPGRPDFLGEQQGRSAADRDGRPACVPQGHNFAKL